MAAADLGDGGILGVAPGASLHLTSYLVSQALNDGYAGRYEKLAAATADASSAVVQNNSWGNDVNIQTIQSDMSSNGYSAAQSFFRYEPG